MKILNNDSLREAIDKIKKSNSICLISHINPDGDSIGSLLGLGIALSHFKDKKITLAKVDEIPKEYKFLPKIDFIQEVDENEVFDLVITLDCGDLFRLGRSKHITDNTDFIINIDHHKSNDFFGDINIVDSNMSSTGELVYYLLREMDLDINTDIATSLYVSISTDTGSFKYDNTSPSTLEVAAELLRKGIDINKITTEIYQSKSLVKTKLLVRSLSDMEMHLDNKIGIAVVTKDMIEECNATIQDVDGIIESIRDIDGVEVACILKEVDQEEIKVGFRSKRDIDVARIAEIFRGGGHKKASGCTVYKRMEEAKKEVIDEIIKTFR